MTSSQIKKGCKISRYVTPYFFKMSKELRLLADLKLQLPCIAVKCLELQIEKSILITISTFFALISLRWKTFQVKFGRYIDPFSISIDIRRSQKSEHGSFIAIDSIRLHNCEPGKYSLMHAYFTDFIHYKYLGCPLRHVF